MSFVASLHPISLVRAICASACRTPNKIAVAGEDGALSYAELIRQAAKRNDGTIRIQDAPRVGAILTWLAGMMAAEKELDETAPAAIIASNGIEIVISHRTLVLRALSGVVEHATFGRERAVMAMALPLDSARGLVAATISLWMGSTLRLLHPGDTAGLVNGIVSGEFETAWFGASALGSLPSMLPPRSEKFRLLICDGLPLPAIRKELVCWLGRAQVAAETGDVFGASTFRHPGLVEQGEKFVGVPCA